AREERYAGLRLAILALGPHGITESRISAMSRPELDGWLNALGVYNNPKSARQTTTTRKRVKSLRQKKTRRT
ncbi:TPA: hypothetical protein O7W75_004861, partial [Salmonella enterica]|nr:hypothetical protein [Salmonella enterica]